MSKITKNRLAMLALAGLGIVASGPALAAGMTVDTKGGLEVFELDESNYWFKVSGRLWVDQAFFDNDDNNSGYSFPSGAHLRSARVTLKGGVGQNWVYKMDIDHKDNPGVPGVARIGEAFIGYSGCKNLWFALGQVSIPFGLENFQNGSDSQFMEVSLPTGAFSPDKGLGLYAEWHGNMFTLAAALYEPQAGYQATGDVVSSPPLTAAGGRIAGTGYFDSDPGSDDWGFDARLTFSPVHDEYTAYHAGVAARYEKFHPNANNFNYVAGLEAQARQTPDIFTNIPPNSSRHHYVWGFELAGRWGPLLLQGEYMLAHVERDDFFAANDFRNPPGDLSYHGYYVGATYVLTGETREYDFDSGTFGGVHPHSRKGAWEIGVRHSFVNLLDDGLNNNMIFEFIDYVPNFAVDQFGNPVGAIGANSFRTANSEDDLIGAAHSTTVGLTWWVNDNVRLMANYVRTDLPNSIDVDILAFRGQVTW